MNCASFRSSILAYTEQDFHSYSVRDFEFHSHECAACAHLLSEFRLTQEIIGKDKSIEPNPFADTRMIQRLENLRERESVWIYLFSLPRFRPLYLSFGLVLAMLLGVFLGLEEGVLPAVNSHNNTDIDLLRTELNVPDMMGDDAILFANE